MAELSRSSRKMKAETAWYKAECRAVDAVCWLCRELIDYDADATIDDYAFQLDHFWPWEPYPNLRDDPTNYRPSHRLCNLKRGGEMPRPELGPLSRDWFGVGA